MHSPLDLDSPLPPSRQIADVLRGRIRSGEYTPGARLPSRSALVNEFKVAPATVLKALDLLKQEGLIISRQGQGVFVRARPERLRIPAEDVHRLIAELETNEEYRQHPVVAEKVLPRVRALLEVQA